MKRWMKLFIFELLCTMVMLGFFGRPPHVFATCGLHTIGDVTESSVTCSVDSNTAEGIDTASSETSTTNTAALTLSNSSITLNSGSELVTGFLKLTGNSTVSLLSGTSKILPGHAVWVSDADADGYAASLTNLYDATASGRRRLSLMRSVTTVDCNDASFNLTNSCIVTAGPLSPQTMADDATIGTYAWTNPNNAEVQDNTGAVGRNGMTENSIKIVKGGVISGNNKSTGSSWLLDANWTTKSYGGPSDLWGVSWTPADINSSTFGMVWSGTSTHYLKATNFGFSIPAGATINGIVANVRGDYLATFTSGNIDYIQITVYYSP